MSESAYRGTCDECGKVYRVPSDDRTWTCKACGGTVRVPAAAAATRPTRGASRSRARRSAQNEDEQEEQPRRARRPLNLWNLAMLIGVLGVLGGGGWFFFSGPVRARGEPDLRKVIPEFDDAWKAGDLPRLLQMVHPQKQLEFRLRFEAMRTNRGWTDGFPAVVASTVPDIDELGALIREEEGIEKSKSFHQLAEGRVICSWQFNPPNETWYIYHVEVPLPDILPRLDAFEAAWRQSDSAALAPFFAPGSASKMGEVVDRAGDRRGWSGTFPALGARTVDPDPATLIQPSSPLTREKIEATYDTPSGALMVRWRMHDASDNWCISGFDFP